MHYNKTSVHWSNFKEMAGAQRKDPELLQVQSSSSLLTLEPIPLQISDTKMFCDTSTGVPHPFVPLKFCRIVFDSLHSLSHPGIQATQHLITARFVWPGINTDVRRWAHTCLSCRRSKVQ